MKTRVAALRFGAGTDVETNLATCLRMIDEAARHEPDLMVLPEFSNHASWYDNKQHCFDMSVPLGGEFLNAIAGRARQHRCYIVINVTLRRHDAGGAPFATGSSVMFDRQGAVLAVSDKQVLMGHENDFLERARAVTPIVSTELGRISLYACMDGVINETPRGLALRGAQALRNSLNSFALDEANLHIPDRAAENKVFVVAAEKVAPLIPEFLLEPVSQATSIPAHFLHGAGESQIVAPDGRVLAKGPRMGEAIVIADIDPRDADDKRRPDGTDIFAARQPNAHGASAVMSLRKDFTIMTPWETRPFDGNISAPVVTAAGPAPGITLAARHPANAQNRFVSRRTDVVDGRPWYLVDAITGPPS